MEIGTDFISASSQISTIISNLEKCSEENKQGDEIQINKMIVELLKKE